MPHKLFEAFILLVKPLVTSLVSSLVTQLTGVVNSITKVFINLESTANAHYSLNTPQTFAGDFEVEVDAFLPAAAPWSAVLEINGASVNNDRVTINSSKGIRLTLLGVNYNSANGVFPSDILNTLKITRVSSTVRIYINGAFAVSGSQSTYLTIDKAGVANGSDFFGGILSNWRNTDLATPANSTEFGLDNLTGNTEVNNGKTLTYQNIATTVDVRDTYTLSDDETEWVGSLQTIDIAAQV